jgi:hypothetical protein
MEPVPKFEPATHAKLPRPSAHDDYRDNKPSRQRHRTENDTEGPRTKASRFGRLTEVAQEKENQRLQFENMDLQSRFMKLPGGKLILTAYVRIAG